MHEAAACTISRALFTQPPCLYSSHPIPLAFTMSLTEHPSLHPSSASPSVAIGILPPLPKIRSGGISKRVFTHSSLAGENRYDFQAPQSDPSTDNEEFGQIGDQVFALAITDLIQDLYPHLRVGPASKVRDHIKRKSLIAEICVQYGLHKVVNLPERQAESLRATQSVQVNVFKAYVGGLFREQGFEVVTKWLNSVFQPHVEAVYQYFRDDYLMPGPQAVLLPREPTASYPSPPSSYVSEGMRPGLSSRPTGERHRSLPPRTNEPPSQQGSGRVGGSMGNRPEVIDRSRSNRRRRRSSQMDSRRVDPDDTTSSLHRQTGSDRTLRSESARKRTRH
ncbi:ribonuclease III domain-containing protein [Russula emetica]|nr:ribonuclease III domain-containing protein [Russula emetica]